MKKRSLWLMGTCLGLTLVQAGVCAAQSATIMGLSLCHFDRTHICSTIGTGVSADGKTVIGYAPALGSAAFNEDGWSWTASAGFQAVGGSALPPGAPGGSSPPPGGPVFPRAVSADGSVVVGTTGPLAFGFLSAAWRYTKEGLMVLPRLTPAEPLVPPFVEQPDYRMSANGVSGDGSVVVGTENFTGRNNNSKIEAYRWTQADGIRGLGSLGGTAFDSRAFGISANGLVIVGESQSANGREAFRWTQSSGMVGLGDLPGGAFSSTATAVSADGSVIVGMGTSAKGSEAFIWTASSGMVGLGVLPGVSDSSFANALSADGRVVVGGTRVMGPGGTTEFNSRGVAFYWTQSTGMQILADVLTRAGVNLSGWLLNNATGVSADGTVIVGTGVDRSLQTNIQGSGIQAFIARIGAGIVAGLTTPESLMQSVANMYAVTLAGDRIVLADRRRVLDFARRYRPQATLEPVRTASADSIPSGVELPQRQPWEAYALTSGQAWNYDPLTQGSSPALSAGIARELSSSWRVGMGLTGQRANEDTIHDGRYETTATGGHAFVSWNAGHTGWRVFGHANYLSLDADIRRGYINGAGTSTSTGSTDGRSYGFLARAEYAWPLNARAELVPFADYSWTRSKLDAYTEDSTTGPFPASFEEQRYRSAVARAGLELGYRFDRQTEMFGWLAYAKRVEGDNASIAGRYLGIGAFNLQNLRVPDGHWGDVGLGLVHYLQPRVRLMGSIGLLAGGSVSKENTLFASVGIGVGF